MTSVCVWFEAKGIWFYGVMLSSTLGLAMTLTFSSISFNNILYYFKQHYSFCHIVLGIQQWFIVSAAEVLSIFLHKFCSRYATMDAISTKWQPHENLYKKLIKCNDTTSWWQTVVVLIGSNIKYSNIPSILWALATQQLLVPQRMGHHYNFTNRGDLIQNRANILRSEQNQCHFINAIFECICWNGNVWTENTVAIFNSL